jgi:iron complex outermembrane recepter protein
MRTWRFMVLTLQAWLAILASGMALADSAEPSDSLETITVTAEKRAENIQNVPLSIVAVTGQTLVDNGISNASELGKIVPSLQINNSTFSGGVILRIRGFGSAPNSGTDSDVASYIDGVFIPRPGAILSSFLDVQNLEVLNGPQGTLSGRNAVVGAISINSNAPSMTKESLDATLEGGNYGTYAATGIANVPVTDNFALRFAVKGTSTEGDYYNHLDDRTYGKTNSAVGRVSAKWDPAENLSWTVRLDGANTTGDGVYPATVVADTASPAQLAALSTFNTRFGGSPQVYSYPPSYSFNQYFSQPYLRDHQLGATSDLTWNLSPVLTARLLDSYRDWENKQLAGDTGDTSLNLLNIYQSNSSKAQSHELQLISDKDAFANGKLGFTSGLYFFREKFGLDTDINAGAELCRAVYTSIDRPFLIPRCDAGPQADAGFTEFSQTVDSYAGYVQVNYAILPSVELDLGTRESYDKKTGVYSQTAQNALAVGTLLGNEGPDALNFSSDRPSFRASLSWHASDQIMVFATFSTGYKSGGFNTGSSPTPLVTAANAQGRNFADETADDYELGLKSIFWDSKFLFNATLFDTELKNFQDRSFNGVGFVVRNAGDVRSRGLDLDGRFRATQNFSVTYAATFLDAFYSKADDSPGLEGCTTLCPTVQNLTGQTISYAPKAHATGGLQWESNAIGSGYILTGAANENYTSSFLTVNTNNPQSRVSGYVTTDLRLRLTSPNDRWYLEAFGTNVLDRRYYVATIAQPLGTIMGINNPLTGASIFRGFLGDPARYGLRANVKF